MKKGDEVVIIDPAWLSYEEMVKLRGGVPRFVKTSVEKGFYVDPDDLKAAINHKTKLVLICTPSNPTGKVLSPENMAAISDVLKSPECENVLVFFDEIYSNILFDGHKHTRLDPALKNRVILGHGLAKAFAAPGHRGGICVSTITPSDGGLP